jgi:hypothetical protein
VVADRYDGLFGHKDPSGSSVFLKDSSGIHERRGNKLLTRNISATETIMLENLDALLTDSKCKAKIIELVFAGWKNQCIPRSNFSIFLGGGFSERKSVGNLKMDEVPFAIPELESTQEEADTHVASCLRNECSKVIVHANDTDIIVILFQHCQQLALLS